MCVRAFLRVGSQCWRLEFQHLKGCVFAGRSVSQSFAAALAKQGVALFHLRDGAAVAPSAAAGPLAPAPRPVFDMPATWMPPVVDANGVAALVGAAGTVSALETLASLSVSCRQHTALLAPSTAGDIPLVTALTRVVGRPGSAAIETLALTVQ